MYNSKIIGLGHYVPDNIVTNDDLSKVMDTNDQWIQERTGIKERRWVQEGDGHGKANFLDSKWKLEPWIYSTLSEPFNVLYHLCFIIKHFNEYAANSFPFKLWIFKSSQRV